MGSASDSHAVVDARWRVMDASIFPTLIGEKVSQMLPKDAKWG